MINKLLSLILKGHFMIEILQTFNEIGIWGIINSIILIFGSLIGYKLLSRKRSRIRDLNFYITWLRDETNRFPLVLHFEIRNLSQNIIIISSAYFKFDLVKPGPYAHCDTVSGEYEIKFRKDKRQKSSDVASLLRHRESVTSYIPLNETQSDKELIEKSDNKRFGRFYCDVIILEKKPKVYRLKLRLEGVVPDEEKKYPPKKQRK